jgi:hypothetical protein
MIMQQNQQRMAASRQYGPEDYYDEEEPGVQAYG